MIKKSCTHCKEEKPLDEYHVSGKARDGRASWCKTCTSTIKRGRRTRTYSTENKRRWQLQTRYKMTPEQFTEMWVAQGEKCALCEAKPEIPHIDHDHNTGAVRGLLCHKCNIRLGGWDDLEWRIRAVEYLAIGAPA